MFSDKKRKYLFKCAECEMILSVDIEDQEDIDKIQDNKLKLECPCGSHLCVLKN
jgi:DNA-directed RNA polymerase subunit RPC12/RpoP